MGRKCNVLHCPSDSRRIEDQGVTFHKIPHHTDLRPKWLELCKIPEGRKNVKVIYVCSRHFLSADFCNFKGTKYMLRQGALPSVFPWSSSPPPRKVETEDNSEVEKPESPTLSEDIVEKTETAVDMKTSIPINEDSFKIQEEMFASTEVKSDSTPNLSVQPLNEQSGPIDFTPGTRIEANDFHDKWYSAKIVEVDYDEKEVFVHFEKCPNRGDEWIPMDSSRLRPLQPEKSINYEVGDRCLATWVDGKKFPATIKRVVNKETFEVLFDDGYIKVLKTNKLSKFQEEYLFKKIPLAHTAPLFEPASGSKQERRDRKRKINVAELFHKKRYRHDEPTKMESQEEEITPPQIDHAEEEEWTCRWINGDPIGEESVIDSIDGQRPSVIVPDNRLPPGWVKHLSKRVYGNSAGKWEVFILNPEGRKFRNKHDIKVYLDETKQDLNIEAFDFGLHLNRARKLGLYEINDPEIYAANTPKPVARNESTRKSREFVQKRTKIPKFGSPGPSLEVAQSAGEETEEDESGTGSLKIIHENDSYKCPIEGCGKNFRKENLAQMHIKHYHPEYTKLLGSTPNVADLAYARTVGENFDEITPKPRLSLPNMETPKAKSTVRVLTPKVSKITENETPNLPKPAMKDAEIIRLLNSDPKSKGFDSIFEPSPTKMEHSMKEIEIVKSEVKYPDKLKELLNTPDLINKKDEIAPTRPTGIKTILPLIRVQEEKSDMNLSDINLNDQSKIHLTPKYIEKNRPGRKRRPSDNDSIKRRRQSLKYDTDEYSDYYEGDSISQDSFQNHSIPNKTIPEATILTDNPKVIIEGGEVIRLVHMKREEIINCTCGITEEDGLMIQCELCLCWQHAHCNNIAKESQVPEKYICYICQNPLKMRSSTKYLHDQDWLKQGTLATADYHSKDQNTLNKRFEKLRKSHELTGNLLELNEFIHNLRIKLNIAENKDHPKLYLWAKQWEKTAPELNLHLTKSEKLKATQVQESSQSSSTSDHSYIKGSMFGDVALQSMLVPPLKPDEIKASLIADDMKIKSQSELISILEDGECEPKSEINLDEKVDNDDDNVKKGVKEDALNTITGGLLSSGSLDFQLSQSDLERLSNLAQLSDVTNPQPNIPQPEAAIDSGDCRMNLLDHIEYFQNLVDEKLNLIENEISVLENEDSGSAQDEGVDSMPKTKQTIQMLIRDLGTVRQIASITQ